MPLRRTGRAGRVILLQLSVPHKEQKTSLQTAQKKPQTSSRCRICAYRWLPQQGENESLLVAGLQRTGTWCVPLWCAALYFIFVPMPGVTPTSCGGVSVCHCLLLACNQGFLPAAWKIVWKWHVFQTRSASWKQPDGVTTVGQTALGCASDLRVPENNCEVMGTGKAVGDRLIVWVPFSVLSFCNRET